MEEKRGFSNEYDLGRASTRSIWNQMSTSKGLSEWLAPRVITVDKKVTVYWDGADDKREGTIVESSEKRAIRWNWDDDPDSYMRMEIVKSDLTGEVSLRIEDYDLSMETSTLEELWHFHIEELRRSIGID